MSKSNQNPLRHDDPLMSDLWGKRYILGDNGRWRYDGECKERPFPTVTPSGLNKSYKYLIEPKLPRPILVYPEERCNHSFHNQPCYCNLSSQPDPYFETVELDFKWLMEE